MRVKAAAAKRVRPAAPRAAPDARALLDWYDRHARVLPWRATPRSRAAVDPYRVWLSEIMLQQTTVATVGPYFREFLARWPTVGALAAAPVEEVLAAWSGLGYYARARNLHRCARAVVEGHDGIFPRDEAALRALPGIGPYTAAAIAAIAFDAPTVPVDGNVERVVARLFAITEPLPDAKPALRAAAATLTPASRAGDFAQALMDLGATVCTPRGAKCGLCPWRGACRAFAQGSVDALPTRRAKPPRPVRHGVAFVLTRGTRVWVRRRPPAGLLGGMLEVPSTPWEEAPPSRARVNQCAPLALDWRAIPGTVRHVFTHFELRARVLVAALEDGDVSPSGGKWLDFGAFSRAGLPTVMRKILAHAGTER